MAGTGYIRQSSGVIITNNTIEASHFNDEYDRLESTFNGSTGHDHDGGTGQGPKLPLTTSVSGLLPIANGGTNAATAGAARTSLGVVIGTDVQAYDAGLLSIAGLTTSADKMVYTTALDVYSTTSLTPFARTILDDGSAPTVRSTIGVDAAGTDNSTNVSLAGTPNYITIAGQVITVSLVDVTSDITGIVPAANLGTGTSVSTKFLRGDGTYQTVTTGTGDGDMLSSNNLSDVASISTSRTNLGLGSLAVLSNINDSNWSGADLAIANGGTGASTASTARQGLGVEIGVNVQAYSAVLQATTASFLLADETKLDGIATSANLYVHPSTAGNKHIPTAGASGQFLKYSASGTAVWAADNDTVYVHPSTAGNKHIPTSGASNNGLVYSASGTAAWSTTANMGHGARTFTTSTATPTGGTSGDMHFIYP